MERCDDLIPLASKFTGAIGATAILIRRWATNIWAAVNGGEVVQHIKGRYLQRTTYGIRRSLPVVHGREDWRSRRVQAIVAARVGVGRRVDTAKVQHADEVAHLVATADHSRRGRTQVGHRIRVVAQAVDVLAVVKDQEALGVVSRQVDGIRRAG